MSPVWNTGICLMTLLINGLINVSTDTVQSTDSVPVISSTLENTGVSTSTSSQGLICDMGKLYPDKTHCNNNFCPVNEDCDPSDCCAPGYEQQSSSCEDIHECLKGTHNCGSHATCRNKVGSYYCVCKEGFQKGNQTEFCPSAVKDENTCTDIDECSISPGICASNLICTNIMGSYMCGCDNGFTKLLNTCVVNCKYRERKQICGDKEFNCNLNNFNDNFTPFCENVTSQRKLSLEELLDGLDDLIDGFTYVNKTDRLQKAGRLLTTVEERVQSLALLEQKVMSLVNKNKTISISVSSGTSDSGALLLQGINSSITLDSITAAGNTGVAVLGCIEYTNITHIMKGADHLEEKSKNKRFELVSPVVSIFLGISNTSSLQQPVSITLNVTKETVSKNMSCVSWSVSDSSWSRKGCVMVESDGNVVTCNCTHLTSFAILMLLHDNESWALTLITKIGLSVSIFCLVLAIITFSFTRALRGTRNTIHTHLCISLLFGNCIFLLGIEAVHNEVLCGIIAGLLHAFYLSSFCWMSLEGLELYRMLVTVFNTHLKKRYLLAVGYGTPAVIITISAAIYHQGYGTEKYCWLSREKGFIWAFMGPVCVIILVNCGIFVLTVWKLAEKMSSISPEQGKLKRIRMLTVTSLAQLCVLGTCWVFGFFMFSSASLFFVYAFTILNTLQGLQIFCLHCLMHKKVRAEYKMWLCALAHLKSPVYSEFSNTTNTQTNTKGKASKESGL